MGLRQHREKQRVRPEDRPMCAGCGRFWARRGGLCLDCIYLRREREK